MRNHEVVTKQPLLKEDGSLREPGWSKSLVQTYDRKQIKAPRMRIKEWDYYLVLNEDFAGAFTLSDDGYIGLQSVSLLNFKEWMGTYRDDSQCISNGENADAFGFQAGRHSLSGQAFAYGIYAGRRTETYPM